MCLWDLEDVGRLVSSVVRSMLPVTPRDRFSPISGNTGSCKTISSKTKFKEQRAHVYLLLCS